MSTRPFANSTHRFAGKTVRALVAAGQTANIDFKVEGAAGRKLNGGRMMAYNAHEDDEIIFQIVDKDNILGYGPDTVLDEFLTWTVFKGVPMELDLPYGSDILDGLWIRGIYKSNGIVAVKVAINFDLHRPL